MNIFDAKIKELNKSSVEKHEKVFTVQNVLSKNKGQGYKISLNAVNFLRGKGVNIDNFYSDNVIFKYDHEKEYTFLKNIFELFKDNFKFKDKDYTKTTDNSSKLVEIKQL